MDWQVSVYIKLCDNADSGIPWYLYGVDSDCFYYRACIRSGHSMLLGICGCP